MRDYRRYTAFEVADELALGVYEATRRFPRDEMYGITSQLRRAAVSIPTNVAEGSGRSTDADFARFLDIAIGSASEVEYLLTLSGKLGYLAANDRSLLCRKAVYARRLLFRLRSQLGGQPHQSGQRRTRSTKPKAAAR